MYEMILNKLNLKQFKCFEYIKEKQEIKTADSCSQEHILEEFVKIINMLNENTVKYKISTALTFQIKVFTLMAELKGIP